MAVQRAEDKTQQMQARAGAIDELIASGALDDASSINRGDDISRELESMSSQSDVEAELAALKGSSPAGDRGPGDAGHRAPAASRPSPSRTAGREGAAVMIVRILGEGQLEVADDQLDDAQRARPRGRGGGRGRRRGGVQRRADRAARRRTPRRHPLPEDSLDDSDLILPPADATIDEVRELLEGDGLIPG